VETTAAGLERRVESDRRDGEDRRRDGGDRRRSGDRRVANRRGPGGQNSPHEGLSHDGIVDPANAGAAATADTESRSSVWRLVTGEALRALRAEDGDHPAERRHVVDRRSGADRRQSSADRRSGIDRRAPPYDLSYEEITALLGGDAPSPLGDDRFLEAAMAAAALVAASGGPITEPRLRAAGEILALAEFLRDADLDEAMSLFQGFADDLARRPHQGRDRVLGALRSIADDPEVAPLVMRVACVLGLADRAVSSTERGRLEELAGALEIAPPEFGDTSWNAATVAEADAPLRLVVGNAKAGSGKTTTAAHLAVALLSQGFRVGTIDMAGADGPLSRMMANRRGVAAGSGLALMMPKHRIVDPATDGLGDRFEEALAELDACRFIVVDTPTGTGPAVAKPHAIADAIITPLPDSPLDIDALLAIDWDKPAAATPSDYCRMVVETNRARTDAVTHPADWIIIRCRLGYANARSSREMERLVDKLASSLGFRAITGLEDDDAFVAPLSMGLTVVDLLKHACNGSRPKALVARRDEVLRMVRALDITTAPAWNRGGLRV